MFDTLPEIRWKTYQWLLLKGVSSSALAYDLPRRGRVIFNKRLFDFDDDGVDAIVLLALDELGEPVDLCAWTPTHRRVAMHIGALPMLGMESILEPRLGQPLRVFRQPMDWLRQGRNGVVIVEPQRAAIALRDAGPLEAEDAMHGRELSALFHRTTPEIFVPPDAPLALKRGHAA